MWTRKDIKEFKDQVRKEKEAVIKIGSGETVTVCIVVLIFKINSIRRTRINSR